MSPDGETATRHERGTSGDASGGTRVSDSPDTRSAIAAYEHRLDLACRKAAEAASAWCWNPTIDNERLLRGAVAEWRTALGLWRLKTREVHNQDRTPDESDPASEPVVGGDGRTPIIDAVTGQQIHTPPGAK